MKWNELYMTEINLLPFNKELYLLKRVYYSVGVAHCLEPDTKSRPKH